ncbi:MAG: dihydrodipicolinate synthase family protein [Candidatus Aminicenantes bacterium]
METDFKGIFAALTTPFIEGEISVDKFKDNIQKYNAFPLSGYVVLGSTGEAVYLTDEESRKLVQTAKEWSSPEKKIMAGTARESTKITLDFTNQMADLGIDAAMIRPPSYFKPHMGGEALKKHYLTIADQAKIPFFIYNIPQYTGIFVDSELVSELSRHPRIIGLKDSYGDLSSASELAAQLDSGFSILLGAGSSLLSGLIMGASGGILRLADIAPAQCIELYELFSAGKIAKARKIQQDLIPLNKAITQSFGIQGLKYALDLAGYYGGLPRLPLLPLHQEGKKEIQNILDHLHLLERKPT